MDCTEDVVSTEYFTNQDLQMNVSHHGVTEKRDGIASIVCVLLADFGLL